MGYELNRLMKQYGVATPTMAPAPQMPGSPPVQSAYTGEEGSPGNAEKYAEDKKAFDERVRKYGLAQKEYNQYQDQFQNRLANTNMYNQAQFSTTGASVPAITTFSPMQKRAMGYGTAPNAASNAASTPADYLKSDAYKDFQKGQDGAIGTMDMYQSPYFGMFQSGTWGRAQDAAYEEWLRANPTAGEFADIKQRSGVNDYDIRNAMGTGTTYGTPQWTDTVRAPSYGVAPITLAGKPMQENADWYLGQRGIGYTDADLRGGSEKTFGPIDDTSWRSLLNTAYPQYSGTIESAYSPLGRSGYGTNVGQIDDAGYNYWLNQLSTGAVSPQDLNQAVYKAGVDWNPEQGKKYDLSGVPRHLRENFDWTYYVNNNPDLLEAKIDTLPEAQMHYAAYGMNEGRSPYEGWTPPPPPGPSVDPVVNTGGGGGGGIGGWKIWPWNWFYEGGYVGDQNMGKLFQKYAEGGAVKGYQDGGQNMGQLFQKYAKGGGFTDRQQQGYLIFLEQMSLQDSPQSREMYTRMMERQAANPRSPEFYMRGMDEAPQGIASISADVSSFLPSMPVTESMSPLSRPTTAPPVLGAAPTADVIDFDASVFEDRGIVDPDTGAIVYPVPAVPLSTVTPITTRPIYDDPVLERAAQAIDRADAAAAGTQDPPVTISTSTSLADADPPLDARAAALQSMLDRYGPRDVDYGSQITDARNRAATEQQAFADMLRAQLDSPEDAASSKAEMYFRLAAAFGSPSKTGHFTENLSLAGKEMAETAKSQRESRAKKLGIRMELQKMKMDAANKELDTLRALEQESSRDRRVIAQEMIREYIASGKPQSTAGKTAVDIGLTPGTPEFNAKVEELTVLEINRQTALINAQLASTAATAQRANQMSPAEINLRTETENNLTNIDQAIRDVSEAYRLNPNSYAGGWLDRGQRWLYEVAGSEDPRIVNTRRIDNLLGSQALGSLRAIFGGNPTEGERAILLELQGIGSRSLEERRQIMLRLAEVLEDRKASAQLRLDRILSGAYRTYTPLEGGQ